MIMLNDVCQYIEKLKPSFDNYYLGFIDKKKEKTLGVYGLKNNSKVMALGGLVNTSYAIRYVSLLVHWNHSTSESEEVANQLFNSIQDSRPEYIGNHRINYLMMNNGGAIDIGRDDNGVCEYVIEFEINYEREEM